MRSSASHPPTRRRSSACIRARGPYCRARMPTSLSTTSTPSGRSTQRPSSFRRTPGLPSTADGRGRRSCARLSEGKPSTPMARFSPSLARADFSPPRTITRGERCRSPPRRASGGMFRLGLLNPNTDERHTLAMRDVALNALPEGCEVTAATAPRGPTAIESEVDSLLAAAEVVGMMQSLLGLDAYLIACFGDPGLDAARELTDAPVVGI